MLIKIIIADEDEMPTDACDAQEISSLNHSAISFSFHKKYFNFCKHKNGKLSTVMPPERIELPTPG